MRVTATTARSSKRPARRPKVVDFGFLEAKALRYLDRFDATVAKLRKHLARAVELEVARGAERPEAERVEQWIEGLLTRYQSSGVLNDQRYAHTLCASLRQRGASLQRIVHKLRAHGVTASVISELGQDQALDPKDDLEAARRLVKRRKLGALRSGPMDPKNWRADLARLARAGFAFSVAREALGAVPQLDDDAGVED
jgi:regulatory protein